MELWHNRILVLDFGSQYTQLIARRIREAQVYSQILPCTASLATILAYRPQGIVLSGGPSSVYEKKAPSVAKELFDQGIPSGHLLRHAVSHAPVRRQSREGAASGVWPC